MIRVRWGWMIGVILSGVSAPLWSWAETSLPIPRTSSATEQQLQEEALYLKEETVSIASRYEQPISEAPSNVYVITDEDIRHSGATDLPTVLRRIPGLEVMQMTGADFDVSMRGDNQPGANKLLVMVDGRSIYEDTQGAVFWKAIPVTFPEIKRIEVQKGPASVLYGFNAFDGIINIITKSPEEMKGATLQVGGGAYGTLSNAAIYANRYKKFSYRFSYGHDQNQQWRNGSALAYRDNKFNVHTEYALEGDSKLTFAGGLVDVNRFDGIVSTVVTQSVLPALGYAQANYERPNFFVRAFWNSYDMDAPIIVNPLLAPFLHITGQDFDSNLKAQGYTYNLEAQQRFVMGPTTSVTVGVNYRRNTLSMNFIDRFRTEDRLGMYLQGEWKPAPLFQLVGGVRYDLDTFINPTISPRGALIFSPLRDHTFRASVAVGYRPPTLNETYRDANSIITLPPPSPSPLPVNSTGSGSLQPEQIISSELEYQGWYLRHRARVRTALFYNHLSDLIQTHFVRPILRWSRRHLRVRGRIRIPCDHVAEWVRQHGLPGDRPDPHRDHQTGSPPVQVQRRTQSPMGERAQRRDRVPLGRCVHRPLESAVCRLSTLWRHTARSVRRELPSLEPARGLSLLEARNDSRVSPRGGGSRLRVQCPE
jgi:outer membrane receptor protein involved in Fe transport